MAEQEDIILEKPEEEKIDEDMDELNGQEGVAPDDEEDDEDEELENLPEELPTEDTTFNFVKSPPEESNAEENKEEIPWFKDKKFMSLALGCLLLICVLVFILFYLTFSKDNIKPDIIASKPNAEIPQEIKDPSYKYDMTQIEDMVQKANALYLKGEVEQALRIYKEIAVYNQSLSNYNLGVVQMNEGKNSQALESFKKAIENGENQTVAAINAAVCALKLGDKQKFKYYIDLAAVYLPKEGKSELYDYYLSLINYYKGFYPEALQMFEKTTVKPYADVAKYLSAKIYAKMDLDSKAVQDLTTQGSFESSLSLGLLYARMGEYDKAKGSLLTAMKIERDYNTSLAALSLVDLKTGNFNDMYSRLNNAYADDKLKYLILDTYPIKTRLNEDLFDINIAQNKFSKDFLKDQKDQFDLLFYFAPYQVFDAKQAALYIKKANIIDYLDENPNANTYLRTSGAISSTNVKLANIINLATNKQLKQANKELSALVKSYPEHSILHYNLALSYAQLQNYELAYTHFSSSYHLDPKNYLAGAFALFCGKLTDKDITRLYNEILDNITADTNFKDTLYKDMLFLSQNDYSSALPYLDEKHQDTPLSLIFEAIIAKENGLNDQSDLRLAKLKKALNDDILSNILYFNSLNSNLNIKEYAQNAQIYFENSKLDYKSLFGGAVIARDFYTSLMQVIGLLNLERLKLKNFMNTSDLDTQSAIETLAYMDIYAQQFGEAYALYNTLIDNYKVEDTHTLFLAAVAAIGSNNPNSAIALLQLSRLSDPNNKETKAALGFLYHEAKNYEPALNQYKNIPDNFKSRFFTFDISK